MELTPEQAWTELQAIRARLEEVEPDSKERPELELRRAELRHAAQDAADSARTRDAIEAELEHLHKRLAAFDSEKINVPAWQAAMAAGGRSARHAAKINEAVAKANAPDRAAIEERISRLRMALSE